MRPLINDFLQIHYPEEKYVVLQGSFARGDADSYSDIDLVVFNDLNSQKEFKFKNQLIQVQETSLKGANKLWEQRFWHEYQIIKDEQQFLFSFQQKIKQQYKEQSILSEVQENVQQFLTLTKQELFKRPYQSRLTILGAVGEAMAYRAWIDKNLLGNQEIFIYILDLIGEKTLRMLVPYEISADVQTLEKKLTKYRDYLENKRGVPPIYNSVIQKKLVANKLQRQREQTNSVAYSFWVLLAELLDLYWACQEPDLEMFIEGLPLDFQNLYGQCGVLPLQLEEYQNLELLCNQLLNQM